MWPKIGKNVIWSRLMRRNSLKSRSNGKERRRTTLMSSTSESWIKKKKKLDRKRKRLDSWS